jgi:outer membrane protein OmpA-like peptidoglycan-associated protein
VNNRILAENRANTAVAALKARGIQNISAASFSASMPVAANSTPEGRARNRRTELIIKYSAAEPVVKKEIEKPEETIVEQPAAAQDLDLNKLDEQLRPGALLRLKDLNFVGGTSVLMREAEPSMKILLQVMQEHPTLKISVEGHVCCANDYMLSRERALKVYLYLTKNGIDETRLSYKAFSNSVPIASEATEDGRTKNRRVEIRIKSI